MSNRETLYDSIYQNREVERKTLQRVMVAGYFNEEETKRDAVNVEQYVSLHPYRCGTP
jgi:hypothetical protein